MFVHEDIWDEFMERFVAGARALKAGRSARSPDATSGRWSTRRPPRRTQRWVDEAVALGGKLLLGGRADGTVLPADDPDRRAGRPPQVCSNEAFAPLVVAFPFRDFDDAIRAGQRLVVRAADRRLHERPGEQLGAPSTSSRSAA